MPLCTIVLDCSYFILSGLSLFIKAAHIQQLLGEKIKDRKYFPRFRFPQLPLLLADLLLTLLDYSWMIDLMTSPLLSSHSRDGQRQPEQRSRGAEGGFVPPSSSVVGRRRCQC